ncbi:hypothetical protein [Microcystis aeruginosa]|uniref:Uncharacterized protein n=1 Tax=Microcystis aeruginosa DA14 TaxID=1987506 RepID=A0A3E0MCN9_MICAE|nr:hypothetical protein [Microcystis aeruginosa]REJ56783.1 MAG: hypothetical protein DWQ56_14025 [Microcystis aeruginosa DA14]CCI06100.1 Similar to tr/P74351/P74351 [Microcystis aeruginosa PCC 7941]
MLLKLPQNLKIKRLILLVFCLVIGIFVWWLSWQSTGMSQIQRPETVAQQIYQTMPDLPKENNYIRRETGAIDPNNTLISRFLRYHQDTKKRFTLIRFDWQLTLGDYLGVNEKISEENYPGQATLTVNPMAADIKAMNSLNRRQRQQLVTLLVEIYNPAILPQETPNPSPSPSPSPPRPSLSKPGDADLLKF